jgi:hypothetical protein
MFLPAPPLPALRAQISTRNYLQGKICDIHPTTPIERRWQNQMSTKWILEDVIFYGLFYMYFETRPCQIGTKYETV